MHELPGVPSDTDNTTYHLMLEKLRALSPGERLYRACKLSDALRLMVMAGIRSRHPNYSELDALEEYARITLDSATAKFAISSLRKKYAEMTEKT